MNLIHKLKYSIPSVLLKIIWPFRTAYRNNLHNIAVYENILQMKIAKDFKEIDEKKAWNQIFQHLRHESSNYQYSIKEAKKFQNLNFNRYGDVNPYDHTRIVLHSGPVDYINASFVKVERAKRLYILTQGPLPNTASHFWLMVWEQNSLAVIMLNKIIEKNQIKCHQYFPNVGDMDEMIFSDVHLSVKFIDSIDEGFYKIHRLKLTDIETDTSREILHFHYLAWPDFGVPQSPEAFLKFLKAVRKRGVLDENVGPAIIHCSAGIGRSGTFCLVDSALIIMEHGDAETFDVLELLLEMRRYRMGLIQTPEQLKFCFHAILKGSLQLQDYELSDNEAKFHDKDDSPPIPPHRSQSLSPPISPLIKTEHNISYNSNDNKDDNNSNKDDFSNRPLPFEPIDDEKNELVRKRKHKDKEKQLAIKVKQMKQKQRNQELWMERKRWLWRTGLRVALLTSAVSCAVLLFRFFST